MVSCIDSSTAQDIAFTTVEYTHSPQLGCNAFWGTFELKPNPNYDPYSLMHARPQK